MNIQLSERKKKILIFVFFLCVAIFLTWPLLPNFFKAVYGQVGDPVGSVWSLKWFRETTLSAHGGLFHYSLAGFPDGIQGGLPLPIIYMPLALVTYLPYGETVAYNLIILLSLALNGFFMFLLAERLFHNRLAALATGVIFAFCPYVLARARYHVTLVEVFVFPLILYVLLNLKEEFNRKNKIIYFIALLLVLNIHPYYSFMVLTMLALLFVFYFLRKARRGRQALRDSQPLILQSVAITLGAAAVTAGLVYLQLGRNSGGLMALARQEGDLYTYAAHAWNYYIPSVHSTFLGSPATQFVGTRLTSTNLEEYILFLGYTNMGLALMGLMLWLSRRFSRFADGLTSLQGSNDWIVPFAVWLGLASYLVSLQPTLKIGSLTLYLPSWFIYKVFPFIRVYSRFGVLVFFSVTLLSGACLTFLHEALARKWKLIGSVLIVAVLALTVSEFLEIGYRPMQSLYKTDSSIAETQDLPDVAVIVEYPFVASDESFNSIYLWNQLYYGKPMLNGYPLGSQDEAERLTVLNFLDPRTPALLAYMGADYVIINKEMYEKGSDYSYPAQTINLKALPPGLEMIDEDDKSALLRIDATRPDAVVLYDPSCSMAASPDMGPGLWLQLGTSWTMKIDVSRDISADIEFAIGSVQGDRDLKIDINGTGEIVLTIGEGLKKISLSGVNLKKGMNEIRLSTEAEQVAYNAVFGGNDSKGVSFTMSFWKIGETPGSDAVLRN